MGKIQQVVRLLSERQNQNLMSFRAMLKLMLVISTGTILKVSPMLAAKLGPSGLARHFKNEMALVLVSDAMVWKTQWVL